MKKLIALTLITLSSQAFALDVNVGDESFSIDNVDDITSNIESIAQLDSVAAEAFQGIDRTLNNAEALNDALDQALSDQNGNLGAAINQVADAAATGAVNGHSAKEVMESAKSGKGVKVN